MKSVTIFLTGICLLQWSRGSALEQVVYTIKVPSNSQCGQSNNDEHLIETLKTIQQKLPPPGCTYPHLTCTEILFCNSSASSGYYQIQAANGSAVQVYCDMEGTHCGGQRGWTRVARLNMTDPSSQCPAGFRVETANNKRFCIRDTNTGGCGLILYESFGLNYSQVCGYARGYSYGTMDCFTIHNIISNHYVDGVSIAYGTLNTHIWTYATALEENPATKYPVLKCPCNNPPGKSAPSFIGNDYYCEAGTFYVPSPFVWYTDDPLWDGMQCEGGEGPCCNHTGMPWFIKNIATHTTDAINVRVCLDESTGNENIGIEHLELYIK